MSDPFSQPDTDPDFEPVADTSGGTAQPAPGAEPPDPDDVNLLGRMMFAEGADHYNVPGAMEGIGWVARNRVGASGFPDTLRGVINQTDSRGIPQFAAVGNAIHQGNALWTQAANPSALTAPNSDAYKRAQDVARGVLSGQIPDPTGGATYYYTSSDGQPPPRDKFFINAMKSGRLVRSAGSVGKFTFLRDTGSP